LHVAALVANPGLRLAALISRILTGESSHFHNSIIYVNCEFITHAIQKMLGIYGVEGTVHHPILIFLD